MGEFHHRLVARDRLTVHAHPALLHEAPRFAPRCDGSRGDEEIDDADAVGRER